MLAEIGLMMGLYIITRMISFLTRKGERKESALVYISAVITILVTLLCVFDFIFRGASSS